MSGFNELTLTQKGLELQTKVQAGQIKLEFTRIAIGDGLLIGNVALVNLIALVNERMSLLIERIEIENVQTIKLRTSLNNFELTQGIELREIGVFCKGLDGNEILYAVSNSGNKFDYIPSKDIHVVEETLQLYLEVGVSANVVTTIDKSLNYMSMKEFGEFGATKQDLTHKRDKVTKITRYDLDTSSEDSKIRMINLSDEVRSAIAGTSPVYPTLQDGDITTEKLADGSVIPEKLSYKRGCLFIVNKNNQRIIVNFNDKTVTIPPGTFYTYGRTFKNITIDKTEPVVIPMHPDASGYLVHLVYDTTVNDLAWRTRGGDGSIEPTDIVIVSLCSPTAVGDSSLVEVVDPYGLSLCPIPNNSLDLAAKLRYKQGTLHAQGRPIYDKSQKTLSLKGPVFVIYYNQVVTLSKTDLTIDLNGLSSQTLYYGVVSSNSSGYSLELKHSLLVGDIIVFTYCDGNINCDFDYKIIESTGLPMERTNTDNLYVSKYGCLLSGQINVNTSNKIISIQESIISSPYGTVVCQATEINYVSNSSFWVAVEQDTGVVTTFSFDRVPIDKKLVLLANVYSSAVLYTLPNARCFVNNKCVLDIKDNSITKEMLINDSAIILRDNGSITIDFSTLTITIGLNSYVYWKGKLSNISRDGTVTIQIPTLSSTYCLVFDPITSTVSLKTKLSTTDVILYTMYNGYVYGDTNNITVISKTGENIRTVSNEQVNQIQLGYIDTGTLDIDTTTKTLNFTTTTGTQGIVVGPNQTVLGIPNTTLTWSSDSLLYVVLNVKSKEFSIMPFGNVSNVKSKYLLIAYIYGSKVYGALLNNSIRVNGTYLPTLKEVTTIQTILSEHQSLLNKHSQDISSLNVQSKKRLYTLREAYARWCSGEKFPIAFAGDSTTDGVSTTGWVRNQIGTDHRHPKAFPYILEQLLIEHTGNPSLRIYNAGFSGTRAEWGFQNINQIFKNDVYGDVKMIGIGWGINDRNAPSNLIEYYNTFKMYVIKIIDWCFENGIQPFLITTQATTEPSRFEYEGTNDYPVRNSANIDVIANTIYRELSQEYNLELIDRFYYTSLFQAYSSKSLNDITETLHFKDIGHQYEAEMLFAKLIGQAIEVTEPRKIGLVEPQICSEAPYRQYQRLDSRIRGFNMLLDLPTLGANRKLFDLYILNSSKIPLKIIVHSTQVLDSNITVNGVTKKITSEVFEFGEIDLGTYHIVIDNGELEQANLLGIELQAI